MSLDTQPLAHRTPLARMALASAYVRVGAIGDGVLALVLWQPGQTAIAYLADTLEGSSAEGRVLREVMLATTGLYGMGLHIWS